MSMTPAEIMIKARSRLLLHHPFFGHLGMSLRLIEREDIPTAYTDGRVIAYSPKFIQELADSSIEEVIFLIAHEIMHNVLMTTMTRGNRRKILWNIASDFVINSILVQAGVGQYPKLGGCYDKKYDNMSVGEVYEDLLSTHGDGNGEGDIPIDGLPETMDDHVDMSPLDVEEVQREWTEHMTLAKNVVKSAGSDLPVVLQRIIDSLESPKFDWKKIVKATAADIVKSDYTFASPNRRFFHSGIMMPGMTSAKKINIAVALDVSGSICDEEYRKFLTEVYSIIKTFPRFEINIACFSTEVSNMANLKSENDFKQYVAKSSKSGGTNFLCWWNYAMAESWYKNTDMILFFTDGLPCGDWCPPNIGKKEMFWIVSGTNNRGPIGRTLFFES